MATKPLGFHALNTIPLVVDSFLRDDALGYSHLRLVCL